MARVLVARQSWGVQFKTSGSFGDRVHVWQNLACSINTTIYAAATGGTPVASFVTNANGELPGWIEEGTYNLTVNGVTTSVSTTSGSVIDRTTVLESDVASLENDHATLLARNLSGTGSPEGARTASPGATYQQTDGAEGATSWVKETGSGNTGWRLQRRIFQSEILLFGPENRASHALVGLDAASYAFQADALSGSTDVLLAGLNARVRHAEASVVWTPNASGCGVELIKADAGLANIVQIAEFTGSSSTTPLNSSADVTSAMQTIVDGTAAGAPGGSGAATSKQIGFRTKGNGVASHPLVYTVRIRILWEA